MPNNINRAVDNSAILAKLTNSSTTDKSKKKVGRPKSDNKRSFEYRVRLTQAESEELLFRAQVLETTPSDILRSFLTFKMPELPKNTIIQREQYLELTRLATNINQIAHALNIQLKAGEAPRLSKDNGETLKRTVSAIRFIQSELLK